MEIATLKDLKEAIKDIPDEILDKYGAGIHPDGGDIVGLMGWGYDEEDEEFDDNVENYPQLKDIDAWITNIAKEQQGFDKGDEDGIIQERDSPISSEDYDKNYDEDR